MSSQLIVGRRITKEIAIPFAHALEELLEEDYALDFVELILPTNEENEAEDFDDDDDGYIRTSITTTGKNPLFFEIHVGELQLRNNSSRAVSWQPYINIMEVKPDEEFYENPVKHLMSLSDVIFRRPRVQAMLVAEACHEYIEKQSYSLDIEALYPITYP